MSKKKNRRAKQSDSIPQKKERVQKEAERHVPKFEIGVKGDEFDVAYTKAAAKEQSRAAELFEGIIKESDRILPNLVCFGVLALIILIASISFLVLSRDQAAPYFEFSKIADGSYTAELSEYYDGSLPFGKYLGGLAVKLGLAREPDEMAEDAAPPEDVPGDDGHDENIPQNTVPTEPLVTTPAPETTVTTVTSETEPPVSAPITETEPEPPETFTMYANRTANVRLEPDSGSMIMGYFNMNNAVDVIEIRDDGWAEIWFGGTVMYVEADELSESRIRVTAEVTTEEEPPETEPEETTETTTETEPETTTAPPTEPETEPETTTRATTIDPGVIDPELSAYRERMSRLSSLEAATATTPVPEETYPLPNDQYVTVPEPEEE